MPSERTRDYLLDVLEAIDHIESTTEGRSEGDYIASRDMKAIVERNLITIGEVLARMRDFDDETVRQITAYSEVIGMRNFIIHEYRYVNNQMVWGTLQRNLPILKAEIVAMLAKGAGL